MDFGRIKGFMYALGNGLGEYHQRPEAARQTLAEIVSDYARMHHWATLLLLWFQIRLYLFTYASNQAVDYYNPPFNQDLCFVEEHFGCDLFGFLSDVIALLADELRKKSRRCKDRFIRLLCGVFGGRQGD